MLFRLEDDDSGVPGLLLRLDMDRNHGVRDLVPQCKLAAVTDIMGRRDGHVARHDEVEVDEGYLSGMACAQVTDLVAR
jgi:hypothetical protein